MTFSTTDEFLEFHNRIEKQSRHIIIALIFYVLKLQLNLGQSVIDFSLIGDIIFLTILFDLVKNKFFGKWIYIFIAGAILNVISKFLALIGLGYYYIYLGIELLGMVLVYYRFVQIHPALKKHEKLVTYALIFVIFELALSYAAMIFAPIALLLNDITSYVGPLGIVSALFGLLFPVFFLWIVVVVLLFILGSKFKNSLNDFNPYDESLISSDKSL